MGEEMCPFLETCLFASAACTRKEMPNCSEALKRQELAKRPCPLMAGTNGGRNGCDIPQLRVFVPSDTECSCGDECLIRKVVPKISGKVAGANGVGDPSKIPAEQLKEAGRAIIGSKIFVKTEPATAKVAG